MISEILTKMTMYVCVFLSVF